MSGLALQQLGAAAVGLAVYIYLLKDVRPWLLAVVALLTAVDYLLRRRVTLWERAHEEDKITASRKLWYINRTAVNRRTDKDVRIFGMTAWLKEVSEAALALRRSW
ncbi:MAG: hypothetical protein GX810_10760 [Clostridiales bacterium]|nr:hypothetical protein [Clostridiales bacterium]